MRHALCAPVSLCQAISLAKSPCELVEGGLEVKHIIHYGRAILCSFISLVVLK